MSFNRLPYDNCAYELETKRSVDMGNYRLFPGSYENCKKSLSSTGIRNSKSDPSTVKGNCDLSWGALAETETVITNRVNPLNKCNNPLDKLSKKVNHKPKLGQKFDTETTRFTNPLTNYRGLSLMEYQMDYVIGPNPQHNIECDSMRNGSSTRLWVQANYKIPKAAPMDNDSILPKSNKPMPKYDINASMNVTLPSCK